MEIGDIVQLIRPYRISTSSDPTNPKSSRMTEKALKEATFYWAYTLRNSKNPNEKTSDRKLAFQIPRNLIFDAISQTNLPDITGTVISFHRMPNIHLHKVTDVSDTTAAPLIWVKVVVMDTYLFIPISLLKVISNGR
jgi:hypothetical protein